MILTRFALTLEFATLVLGDTYVFLYSVQSFLKV